MKLLSQVVLCTVLLAAPKGARAGFPATFEAGSLIIPMDLAYQDTGIFQAYGLVFQLLRQGITVNWVIDPFKTYHSAACNTAGDLCPWDCAVEGSGVKCAYPTASPDFFTATRVFWNNAGQRNPGTTISSHGYRAGPFVIDATQAAAAAAIIDIWNDSTRWAANPWAQRTISRVVAVHEATAAFNGYVTKEMLAAPTIAVFTDGNQKIATAYLRAAGIPQSNGAEFPADINCDNTPCGPDTANPDMLTVPSIMGPMGACNDPNDALNRNHKNGSLFTPDGIPAYCQIMSMHWNVNDRNTVTCTNGQLTYHGHEVVAEVRSFLNYPTHFFAECQAVNAYENTVPIAAAPFYDDPGRIGHYLTTTGNPPSCVGNGCPAGADTAVGCVVGGCDGGTRNCCLATDDKEFGAGFLIGAIAQIQQPSLKVLNPVVPYNQMDGYFKTVGGSEKSYNLSTYLQTAYKNNLDVTFITGPLGPGLDDVWMTGYLDGTCDIHEEGGDLCQGVGKVSYLGGHSFGVGVPLSANTQSHGTRMFLNALFEADCVTSVGQPNLTLGFNGDLVITGLTAPVTGVYAADYTNYGIGPGLEAVMTLDLPAGVTATTFDPVGAVDGNGDLNWDIGSIGTTYGMAGDPPHQGTRGVTLSFAAAGGYSLHLRMSYRVGVSTREAFPVRLDVRVVIDSDGDGVSDEIDQFPTDPARCGDLNADGCDDCGGPVDVDQDGVCDSADSDPNDRFVCRFTDADNCDDCASGTFDPANDGPDLDGDGLCDNGDLDIDGDGVDNVADGAPTNRFACADTDGDGCDDCAIAGSAVPANDGLDTDGDGVCNAGDPDDDGDTVPDGADLCATGETGWTSGAATDFDGDGCRDAGEDLDDDNDGISDASDPNPLDTFVCGDTDADTCDDCAVAGMLDPFNDGPDDDADGRCNAGDPADTDPTVCGDLDADLCDDCALGLGPDVLADGVDTNGDGECDLGDTDDDGDGVGDGTDVARTDRFACQDNDTDSCDDCSVLGLAAPLDDGVDYDGDGLCNLGDGDDDGDGVTDASDGCATGETGWTSESGNDRDGDGCRDASEDVDDDNDGVADAADACPSGETGWTAGTGTDADGDGCRDASEDLDDDNDGVADAADVCPAGESGWTSGAGTDADGDGCRDASEDLDDDNDGVSDADEAACGADPLDPGSACEGELPPPGGQVYKSSCGCGAAPGAGSAVWALLVVAGALARGLRARRPKR